MSGLGINRPYILKHRHGFIAVQKYTLRVCVFAALNRVFVLRKRFIQFRCPFALTG